MTGGLIRLLMAACLAGLLMLGGCKGKGGPNRGGNTVDGAGATFPYPIYAKWASKYHQIKKVRINYQSIGSGGGIAQITKKTVDFGASDKPLKKSMLDKLGLIQFPMVVGGVVPVVNINGITSGKLKLSAALLAKIFLGEIKKWNDPALVALNAGVSLPNKDITVVRRSDGSGTTWIFTNYLSKVSPTWKSKVGNGKAVAWPVGVGGKGNEGVAAYVKRVDGAIGYVELAYALKSGMSHALLQNKAGKFVGPTIATFQAAAANADWKNAPGFRVVLTDQPGANSWPITGATYILMYKVQTKVHRAKLALAYFDWCYRNGQEMAKTLHYVPIPPAVVRIVQESWRKQITHNGKPIWN